MFIKKNNGDVFDLLSVNRIGPIGVGEHCAYTVHFGGDDELVIYNKPFRGDDSNCIEMGRSRLVNLWVKHKSKERCVQESVLSKLEEIRCGLIDVESSVEKKDDDSCRASLLYGGKSVLHKAFIAGYNLDKINSLDPHKYKSASEYFYDNYEDIVS